MLKHTHGDVRYHRNSLNHSLPVSSPMHHGSGYYPNSHHRLNINLSTSKHSLGGGTSSSGVSPSGVHYTTIVPNGGIPNGIIPTTPNGNVHTYSNGAVHSSSPLCNGNVSMGLGHISGLSNKSPLRPPSSRAVDTPPSTSSAPSGNPPSGSREMLTSLGLLCVISLLLALLSLIFLLKISPVTAGEVRDVLRTEQLTLISPEEYVVVYEVTLALCALSLSLNLCALLVCTVQFLFSVKLVRSERAGNEHNRFLSKSATTRVCAIGGLFVSIPIFLTGIILYTFIQFHSTPAMITSSLIGVGIVFCGCAMVHNVFVWQREKTRAVRAQLSLAKPAVAELSTLV